MGSFGNFHYLPDRSNETDRYIAYEIDQDQNAFVTLSLSADSLTVMTNICPGRLAAAIVTERFQALSGEGQIKVLIVSKGMLPAKFTVRTCVCLMCTALWCSTLFSSVKFIFSPFFFCVSP